MVRAAALITLASFAMAPQSAFAEVGQMATGNDVLDTCSSSIAANQSMCFGYIEGLVRRDDLARWMAPASAYLCDFPGVTRGQTYDVIIRYLRDHPETRHHDGASLSLTAMRLAFCKK